MTRLARCWGTLGFALLAACDLTVAESTTTLANRGAVFGVRTPNAVSVGPAGILVVLDADAFGLGRVIEQGDALPPPVGAAIVADRGVVRALRGTAPGGNMISGGNVLVVPQDPATPPRQPAFGQPPLLLASALVARNSAIEIDGARLVASGVFGIGSIPFAPAPAVSVTGSNVQIRSGTLSIGPGTSDSRSIAVLLSLITLRAAESRVEISGGEFVGGRSLLTGTQTRITGGNLGTISLGIDVALLMQLNPTLPLPSRGCTELRGGSVSGVSLDGPDETLIIFGTGFNLPLGTVPVPALTPRVFGAAPAARVTGELADGTPLDLPISVFDGAARIILAAPDGRERCAP